MIIGKKLKNMKNKIIALLLLLMVINNNYAQKNQIPSLGKDEMIQDIDFLYNAIKEVCPNLDIRKKVTGTDLYAELDNLRVSSSKINTFEEFYYLASKMLILSQDQHNNLVSFAPKEKNHYISNKAKRISEVCEFTFDKHQPNNCTDVTYINGECFFHEDISNMENLEIMIPYSAKLLAINDIPIDEYIQKWNRKVDSSIRWDFKNNKYYTNRLYQPYFTGLSDDIYTITYSLNDSTQTINMNVSHGIAGRAYSDSSVDKVLYFTDKDILYIRIAQMDFQKIKFYQQEIRKYHDKKIKKIIIDIRDNGGGSDLVWTNVLSAIIDKPITIEEKLYLRNSPLVIDYMENIRKAKINTQNPVKLANIENGSFIDISGKKTISPSKNSINFEGKIYVLVNHKCFSSALAFSAFCNRTDKLITVGQPTNSIGGTGITPFFFTLPNSKLIFEISPTLDATNVEKADDYYDNYTEIYVPLSLNDVKIEQEYTGERYNKYFLYNHDVIFKAVLSIE